MSSEVIKEYSIGVDIGGSKMLAVLVDSAEKEVVADYRLVTPRDSLEKFLVMLWALVDPLMERARKEEGKVIRIGIGVPGILDQPSKLNEEGAILKCPNLEILDGVRLGEIVREKYRIPVRVDNDANCFLRAEMVLGAAQKAASAVAVTIGTGIGGAMSIGREIYDGVHGSAGEIGHTIVDVVDGTAYTLEEIYHQLTQANPRMLAEEAYEGDELAERAYEEIGRFIGIALANMVNVMDPEIIVLGGSVMQSSGLFMNAVKNNLKEEILSPKLKKIKIVEGKIKDAGAVGAALLE